MLQIKSTHKINKTFNKYLILIMFLKYIWNQVLGLVFRDSVVNTDIQIIITIIYTNELLLQL